MAAAELAGLDREETGSLSWEFEENTSLNLLLCDQRNIEMAPVEKKCLIDYRVGQENLDNV